MRNLVVALLSAGTMLAGQTIIHAGEQSSADRRLAQVAPNIVDVALRSGGELTGRIVDQEGNTRAGAVVRVQYGAHEVARVAANDTGVYRISGLRPGLHTIVSGTSVRPIRLWEQVSAPPTARDTVNLVFGPDEPPVRGQLGWLYDVEPLDVVLLGITTASLVIAADIQEDVDDLKAASP